MKLSIALLPASLLWASCVSDVGLTRSGFLSTYAGLEAVPGERARETWFAEGLDLSGFHAVIVDPIELRLESTTTDRLSPSQAALLQEHYAAWVVEGLGERFTVTNEQGPGVLRVRTALTEADTINLAANWIMGVIVLWPFDYGGGTLEVEVVDSQSGERMAAMVNADRATAWNGFQAMIRIGHVCQAAQETAG